MVGNGADGVDSLRVLEPKLVPHICRELTGELKAVLKDLNDQQGEMLGLASMCFARCDYKRGMDWASILGCIAIAMDAVRAALEQVDKAGKEAVKEAEAAEHLDDGASRGRE